MEYHRSPGTAGLSEDHMSTARIQVPLEAPKAPEDAIADMAAQLQRCQQEGLLETAHLQALYDLACRIPTPADYPALQAIADRWAVL